MTIASKLFFYQRPRGGDRNSSQPDAAEAEPRPFAPSHRRTGGRASSGDPRRVASSPSLKSSGSSHRLQNSSHILLVNNEASSGKYTSDERLPDTVRQARERLLLRLRSINLTGTSQSENESLENQLTITRSQSDVVMQFTKQPLNLARVISGLKCKVSETSSECSICLEKFLEEEELTQLNCKHVFHSVCLEKWVPLHSDCPYCRASVLA